MGDSVVVDWVDRSCVVTLCGYETRADLLLLDMIDFEVILGIDRLSLYYAILDCHAKTVSLVMPRLEWRGSSSSTSCQVISFLNARYMVEKGCLAYLDFVQDTVLETPTINSVTVVREFFDVFPAELPGMLLNHGVDFDIDLAPDAQYISILPYRMAPAELRELKEKLQELLEKEFIRPSVSP
ncbi:uncharacterized protein LOC142175945 [Nicotiana tabacum]|uniref:Uncharacterized protein LOC142175945 n=1 Tax=Nicotiana tabacum TaxID=4097 RepID=A0AC58TP97_TOBAC